MKVAAVLSITILGTVPCFLNSCTDSPPPNQPIKWKHVSEVPEANPPRGNVTFNDHGNELTLPDGKKFITTSKHPMTEIRFPNGQVFRAETARNGFGAPYVSEDEKLVANILVPSTQSGELHLYMEQEHGKFIEFPEPNGSITKVLKEAGAPFGADALRILGLNGRTLSLAAIDYSSSGPEADLFRITISPTGTYSLEPF